MKKIISEILMNGILYYSCIIEAVCRQLQVCTVWLLLGSLDGGQHLVGPIMVLFCCAVQSVPFTSAITCTGPAVLGNCTASDGLGCTVDTATVTLI